MSKIEKKKKRVMMLFLVWYGFIEKLFYWVVKLGEVYGKLGI